MKAQFLVMVAIPANDAGIELERIIEVEVGDGEYGHSLQLSSAIVKTTNELLGGAGVTMGWKRVNELAEQLVGTMQEGIKCLEKIMNKFRCAGVEETAEALAAVGRMKVQIARCELHLKELKYKVSDPNWDSPCHSFFSKD